MCFLKAPMKHCKDQCMQGYHLKQPGALLKAFVSCLTKKPAFLGSHFAAERGETHPQLYNTHTLHHRGKLLSTHGKVSYFPLSCDSNKLNYLLVTKCSVAFSPSQPCYWVILWPDDMSLKVMLSLGRSIQVIRYQTPEGWRLTTDHLCAGS